MGTLANKCDILGCPSTRPHTPTLSYAGFVILNSLAFLEFLYCSKIYLGYAFLTQVSVVGLVHLSFWGVDFGVSSTSSFRIVIVVIFIPKFSKLMWKRNKVRGST
jgi:hypothetical protein